MNKVRIPGFTASASLRPTTANHRAVSDGLAAREAIMPQMEIPDPSDTRDQPPIHFHPPPQDDRPPWWLGDNRPPWVDGSAGSGDGGGGWGWGESDFQRCLDNCAAVYKNDKKLCMDHYKDEGTQALCVKGAFNLLNECTRECARNRSWFPWPW